MTPQNVSDYVLFRFRAAIESEYRLSGHRPTVAVLGSLDYDATMNCMRIMSPSLSAVSSPTRTTEPPSYEGVQLFKSRSFTTGIFVGGEP